MAAGISHGLKPSGLQGFFGCRGRDHHPEPKTQNPRPLNRLNPKPLNAKPLNPKPKPSTLNPKPLNPKLPEAGSGGLERTLSLRRNAARFCTQGLGYCFLSEVQGLVFKGLGARA